MILCVPQIKKLSRWEVIDVVRTMSTEQAKAGQEGKGKEGSFMDIFRRDFIEEIGN